MPVSLRAQVSRGSSSSRPYDRCSPIASPAQSENPLAHPHLSQTLPPASFIQGPDPDPADPDTPRDYPGLPTHADYKRIEAGYLHSLSPRKRDKALITQAMFDKIWDVLHQPDACTIETPQFRFWVRKMFSLSLPMCVDGGAGAYEDLDLDSDAEGTDLELERAMGIRVDPSGGAGLLSAVVLHENRPVAIMEQLYELFCYCHVRAGHGGRDKTCAVIRQHYSWVPKELTAQFVKACPTCALKRIGGGHAHGGVGVDMGVLMQRRVVGQRERRVPLGAEDVPSSLSSAGWPTTGGPLDPANPEPCGLRERAQRGAHEDTKTVGLPADDASASRRSRDHLCDTTNRPGAGTTTSSSQPCAPVHENGSSKRARTREEKRSSTQTVQAGLPSLASALSDQSLDKNVDLNLSRLGGAEETPGGCLPPVLRPLRLTRPVPVLPTTDMESDLPLPPSLLLPPPSEPEPEPEPEPSSYLFQIDPILLSLDYPGLAPASLSEPLGCTSVSACAGIDAATIPVGLSSSATVAGLCRLPAWHDASSSSDAKPALAQRLGSVRDPLAMLYHCATDEVGKELDGTFSFSIMTDA